MPAEEDMDIMLGRHQYSVPGPSARREQGARDAINGRAPMASGDKSYMKGYELGQRYAPNREKSR